MKLNLLSLLIFSLSINYTYSQEKQNSFFKKKNIDNNSSSSSIKSKTFFKKNDDESNIDLVQNSQDIVLEDNDSLILKEKLFLPDTLLEVKKINFLDSPVENARISSSYSKNRFHPLLKKWSAHKGTDFAAPYGSSIKATAGGTIEKTGYTSGNGNFVKIKHNSTYSTQYLHMSEILVAEGDKIKIGEEIGLVGSTGLATGPHVCYRFWKNNIQVDPFTLDFSEEHSINENTEALDATEETENEKEFKIFVSGFFKKNSDEN